MQTALPDCTDGAGRLIQIIIWGMLRWALWALCLCQPFLWCGNTHTVLLGDSSVWVDALSTSVPGSPSRLLHFRGMIDVNRFISRWCWSVCVKTLRAIKRYIDHRVADQICKCGCAKTLQVLDYYCVVFSVGYRWWDFVTAGSEERLFLCRSYSRSLRLSVPKVQTVVYCTRSVYPEENEQLVKRVLEKIHTHPKLLPFR